MKKYNQTTSLLYKIIFPLLIICIVIPSISNAGIITAQRGKFAGRVSVSGAKPNEPNKTVQQSTTKGGNTFIDTGFTLSSNAAGSGSVAIPNISSGTLLTGHNVRVICSGGVICGPSTVTKSKKWFASYTPGTQQAVNIEIAQSNMGNDGLEFLETWEPGSIWALILDPAEASWVNTGLTSISNSQGDLVANILNISSSIISFMIVSDPTPLTANSIFIDGVDLNVLAGITTINPLYGIIGDTSSYLDGNLLLSQTLNEEFVLAPSINAIPLPSAVWLFGAGLMVLFKNKIKFKVPFIKS